MATPDSVAEAQTSTPTLVNRLDARYSTFGNRRLFIGLLSAVAAGAAYRYLAYPALRADATWPWGVYMGFPPFLCLVVSCFAGRYYESIPLVGIVFGAFGLFSMGNADLLDAMEGTPLFAPLSLVVSLVIVRIRRVVKTQSVHDKGLGVYREYGSNRVVLAVPGGAVVRSVPAGETAVCSARLTKGAFSYNSTPFPFNMCGAAGALLWGLIAGMFHTSEVGEATVHVPGKDCTFSGPRILFARGGTVHIAGIREPRALEICAEIESATQAPASPTM